MRMAMASIACEIEKDHHMPAHQRLGLAQAAGVLKELGQVVESSGNLGILAHVACFIDVQGMAVQ
jgi:hypothetical protein